MCLKKVIWSNFRYRGEKGEANRQIAVELGYDFHLRSEGISPRELARKVRVDCARRRRSQKSLSRRRALHARVVMVVNAPARCGCVRAVVEGGIFTERVCERSDFIIHKVFARDRDLLRDPFFSQRKRIGELRRHTMV